MDGSRDIHEELKRVGKLFRDGDEDVFHSEFAELVEKINSYILNNQALREDEERLRALLEPFHEALSAQERKDWIRLGDILEFEIAPLLLKPEGGEAVPPPPA